MTQEKSETAPAPDPRRGALVGLAVILILLAAGMVLVHILRGTSRIQDCVMSGRTNCAPIDQPTSSP
jgi:hypothetical protein